MMPAEKAYGHANVLQFLTGYDIPMTITYTARMPFKAHELPWPSHMWTPEAGEWLRQKQVRMLVFPYEEYKPEYYQDWIRGAREAVPGLVVLDRTGKAI